MTVADFNIFRHGDPGNRNRFPHDNSTGYLITRIVQLEKEKEVLSDTRESFNAHLRSSSRAFNDLMEEKKELTACLDRTRRACSCLLEANAIIRSCTSPADLLQDLCNTLNQWGFPYATALSVTGPGTLRVMASAGAGYSPTDLDLSSVPWDEVKLIRRTLETCQSSRDICLHRPFVTFTDDDLCRLPLPVLAVPVISRARTRGILLVYEQSGETFEEEDIALLSEISRSLPQSLSDFILA